MTAAPLPAASATGVRIGGDHYQWLHVWRACLQVIRDNSTQGQNDNPAIAVEVEARNVGNVDDVVLFRTHPPHTYSQIKYTANYETPVSTEFLTETKSETGMNLLTKFAEARRRLTTDGATVEMVLTTNRNIDTNSKLLSGRDPRGELLMPKAGEQGKGSARGLERAQWATAAGIDESELFDLLRVLRFNTGNDLHLITENVGNLMAAVGLRSDENAILLATSWVSQQVRNGIRRLDRATVESAIDTLHLRAGRAWPTLSIATLKPDPLADQAMFALDWVDRFEEDDPYTRRRPRPPATWAELQADLNNIPNNLGGDAALITGSLRLATGFALGASLRQVTGIDIAWKQGSQLWRSDHTYDAPLAPAVSTVDLNQGDETAIVIDVATTATPDVIDWLRSTNAPVGTVLTFSPPSTVPKDNAIPDPTTAIALAVGIRDAARAASRNTSRIHLFQAGPLGLALLLGHRWNRICPTEVYEDLGASDGYEHAFHLRA